MAVFNSGDNKFYCECGCGTVIPFYNQFSQGHHFRLPEARERAARQIVVNCHSQETIRRSRATQKRNWDLLSSTEKEERLGISVHSEAAREASREAHRNSEYRVRASRIAERDWAACTPEEKRKRLANGLLSEASQELHRETTSTSEFRTKMGRIGRRSMLRYWAGLTPEEKAGKIRDNPWFHSFKSVQRPNGPEKQLWIFLDKAFSGMFIPDWVERIDIGSRYPDFWVKDGHKLVIESFGTYYHGSGSFEKPSEEELISHYRKYGYECLVVWADNEEDIIFEWPELARKIGLELVPA